MAEKRPATEAEIEEGLRATRRARRDWVLELHNAFRPAQEEAFEQWDAWQQAIEDEGEEVPSFLKAVEELDIVEEKVPSLPKFHELPAAASTVDSTIAEEIIQEPVSLVPFNTFEVEGIRYEAFTKAGSVFLRPSPMPPKARLFLNEKGYPLECVDEDSDLCRVVNLKTADLQSFLGRHRRNPSRYQIRFDA